MTQDATLARFIEAQAKIYDTALAEIRAGSKRNHGCGSSFLSSAASATARPLTIMGSPRSPKPARISLIQSWGHAISNA